MGSRGKRLRMLQAGSQMVEWERDVAVMLRQLGLFLRRRRLLAHLTVRAVAAQAERDGVELSHPALLSLEHLADTPVGDAPTRASVNLLAVIWLLYRAYDGSLRELEREIRPAPPRADDAERQEMLNDVVTTLESCSTPALHLAVSLLRDVQRQDRLTTYDAESLLTRMEQLASTPQDQALVRRLKLQAEEDLLTARASDRRFRAQRPS